MSYAIIGFGKIGQALAKAFARNTSTPDGVERSLDYQAFATVNRAAPAIPRSAGT